MDPASSENWAELFREHSAKMVLYARQFVGRQADAEDIVQNAFIKCWKNRTPGAEMRSGELFGCVRWAALDWLRAGKRRLVREDAAAALDGDIYFERSAEKNELAAAAQAALEQLAPEQRECVVLKIWGGLTFDEIGEATGVSLNTASSRFRYGLQKLAKLLGDFAYVR